VIGLGNRWRRDDGAGLEVVERLRGRLPGGVDARAYEGEPTGLIDVWAGARGVWLLDAVQSGAAPGTLHRLDAARAPLPAALLGPSSHHVGLAEAVELARVLGRLPDRAVVYGVEGGSFDVGEGLTPPVATAVDSLVERLVDELAGAVAAGAPA
jgi:hydrogenase maturation protease